MEAGLRNRQPAQAIPLRLDTANGLKCFGEASLASPRLCNLPTWPTKSKRKRIRKLRSKIKSSPEIAIPDTLLASSQPCHLIVGVQLSMWFCDTFGSTFPSKLRTQLKQIWILTTLESCESQLVPMHPNEIISNRINHLTKWKPKSACTENAKDPIQLLESGSPI
jgi:hypothetical protein